MNQLKNAAAFLACGLLLGANQFVLAQRSAEVRRAQPVEETPIPRALPVDAATPPPRKTTTPPPLPTATPRPVGTPPDEDQPHPESNPGAQQEAQDQRQLEYANGLFARKM